MSMSVQLTPHGEELLKQQLAREPGCSAGEVIERALETLVQLKSSPSTCGQKSVAEAVDDILELRKGNRLNGLNIRDLLHEGHKY